MAGTILYKLSLDSTQFATGLNNAMKSLDKAAKQMQKVGENMSKYITAPLVAAGVASVMAWDQSAKALAQVEAGVKSTGGAAGFTTKQLADMAGKLTDISRLDDDEILQKLTAQMLTFTNVAGKQFEDAQVAALNLAARLDGDLQSAAIMVGKALNDPIKGLTAMGRAGVQFTESQKATIKALWETGQAAAAQNVILAELEKQYGGSSEATLVGAGKIIQLKNSLGNLSEEFGRIIMDYIAPFVDYLRDMIKGFQNLDEGTKRTIVVVGGLVAAIGPAILVIAQLVKISRTLAITVAAVNWEIVLIVGAIAALAAAGVYLWQNWKAVSERISDWSWWRNMLIEMTQWFLNTASQWFDILTTPFRKLMSYLGIEVPKWNDMFKPFIEGLDKLKTEPKEYTNQFGSFWDAMKNGTKDAAKYFGLFRQSAENDLNAVGNSMAIVAGSFGSLGRGDTSMKAIGSKSAKSVTGGDNTSGVFQVDKLLAGAELLKEKGKKMAAELGKVALNLSDTVQQSFGNMFSSFAESFAEMITGTSGIKSFFSGLLNLVLDFTSNFGKALIAAGVGALAFKKLLINPAAAIIAGGVLVGLTAVVRNLLSRGPSGGSSSSAEYNGPSLANAPKLATGGLAYAPTLATVGDNANAHINPEVIAPLSDLKQMIGMGEGSGMKTIRLVASGGDLAAVLTWEQLRQLALR